MDNKWDEKIPFGSKPLRASDSFILKDLKNQTISARLDKLLTIILKILNGTEINFLFHFFSNNMDHILYCLHNSYTKIMSHNNWGRSRGFTLKIKSLKYVNYSSNTHSFPPEKIHGCFCYPG